MPRRIALACALAACLAGFVVVLAMVVTGTGLVGADEHVNRVMSGACCTPTQHFWDRVTAVVSPPVDITVLAVTGVVLSIRWRRLAPVATAALALAIGGGAVLALKYAVDRPAPQGVTAARGAFPSGHTSSAIVFLGAAVLIASRGPVRGLLLAAVALLTGLVGTGLVYDRYHWLTDVLGSLLLAPVLLYAVTRTPPYRACQRLLHMRPPPDPPPASHTQRPADDLLHDLGGAAVDRLHS